MSAGLEGEAAVAAPRPRSRADELAPSDLGTAAWLWALPCAAVGVALLVALGPPLSRALYPAPIPVLPTVEHHPEALEDTRYLISLLAPVLLAASIALLTPRVRIPRRAAIATAGVAQLVALVVVVASLVKQREPGWQVGFFTVAQLAGAAAGAAALAPAAQRGWLGGRRDESRALRAALLAVALVLTGVWFLSFLNTAGSITHYGDSYNTAFMADEAFAVLNGHTPLVDHTMAYGSLWPLLLAPLLALLGKTLLAWTFLMWGLAVAMLIAIYGVLRRATHSSLGALALYVPVMVFTFFGASRDIHHPIAIYQQVPLRNAAPFLLAWLVARRLERGRGATWPLFVAAGLAALNNVDFGVAALGATVAALLWSGLAPGRRDLARLAAEVALGLLAAYALVAIVTLIRAGALPDPARTYGFARLYAAGGVGIWKLPHILGLPLVVYLTYAAALAVATVRALRREPDRLLTGMLAWSAIFGFGSGAYYMGASVPFGVPTLFPAWALSLALLAVVAVRSIAARRDRLPGVPALAALFGIALLGTFVFIPPPRLMPWSQVDRLSAHVRPYAPPDAEPMAPPHDPAFRRFVSSVPDGHGGFVVRPHAAVAFFTATGHLIADGYGLRDVVPYTGRSVFTTGLLDEALRRLRSAGGSTALVPLLILPRVAAALSARGFEALTRTGLRTGVPGRDYPTEELVTRSAGAIRNQLTKWVLTRTSPP
jgi:hypothetical protein